MAKGLGCKELGQSCDFIAKGRDEDEVVSKLEKHAKEAHGMKQVSDKDKTNWKKHVHDV